MTQCHYWVERFSLSLKSAFSLAEQARPRKMDNSKDRNRSE